MPKGACAIFLSICIFGVLWRVVETLGYQFFKCLGAMAVGVFPFGVKLGKGFVIAMRLKYGVIAKTFFSSWRPNKCAVNMSLCGDAQPVRPT